MKVKDNQRFFYAFLLSLLLHALIIALVMLINHYQPAPPRLQKVKLDNLLVLKRGQSQDPTKNTKGARKPSLAAKPTAPSRPTPRPTPKPTPSPRIAAANPMPKPREVPKPQEPQKQEKPKKPEEKPKEQEKPQEKKQVDSKRKALDTYEQTPIDPKNLSFIGQNDSDDPMMNMDSGGGGGGNPSEQDDKGSDPETAQEIDDLYGEEFGDLGTAEKDFIRDNLRNIGRITQKYLQYPRVAAYFGQSGVNAVEFYLHPNGDISDLKIIRSSGLNSFDNNTLNTIQIAYKDYPRPKVKTLIRINVTYSYYGN
ncbi:energy transducer TonB [Helicobacter mustelae]|uniref:Putative siderophore-mediated iron transport protein n=1 Tax=Helicobacter mustelae (strain ATCC 43772 / CCUG 25715 / CIP 103759 / LMG 18044 / NCTC 12198 / R85-136P) TaxID=679897 RepID=D3UGX2_HELM1|nr:TonB family protein [Helicobacter mustelae]CBG39744.1 Putative siderophore-mediated iron transport protein [Helicobacter mustelae 12198]SQH71250.1 siderophore-mediated iron transport protein [Helicobacter mustelae]STP12376.1 siderophore-mediated iron transport protein [Helicobacter mustelae]